MWGHSYVGSFICGVIHMYGHSYVGSFICGVIHMWGHDAPAHVRYAARKCVMMPRTMAS